MNTLLGHEIAQLKTRNAYWTAKEITQQPQMWQETAQLVASIKPRLLVELAPFLDDPDTQVILTGAGTSAYIGDAIATHLNAHMHQSVRAVSTTDLVAAPRQYLATDKPCLLVSFARSGNSPESVAAVELVTQLVSNSQHLFITCNRDGKLHQAAQQASSATSILLPEPTLDQSFAMTSSYSSMMVAALQLFAVDDGSVDKLINAAQSMLAATEQQNIRAFAQQPFERLVYLGSGCLLGFAKEAALKMLELSAGQVMSVSESPLGFRHGPKSLINSKTVVVCFISSDGYTSLYDQDLVAELQRDGTAMTVHSLCPKVPPLEDVWQGLLYMLFAQQLSFYKALNLGISPDNPCPSGEVNRVVQGVVIHPFGSEV
ncbi:SIS domain-containing protein [Pseudoalteromonas sp. A22]|uniref:SIS domain-containing protein n=1 Tax=Pseudoalteromonas sp. A22 TaxID=327511 RepID=UPI001BACAC8D|nr:SIS domain-containing protein [Pseudoalteromonas sp. A22]QUI65099.1 SIS domain-containing protein [Pseudoalteromonas sp. A22]